VNDQPKHPGAKTEDPETEKIILARIATADSEPTSDPRQSIAEIRTEIRKTLKHPVPR
jgi:hypothetical protein